MLNKRANSAIATILAGCLMVPALTVQAQDAAVVERGPYDLSKLRGICGFVYSRGRDRVAGSGYRYTYQRMMAEAAGVQPGDGEETRRTRIRYLWLDNQDSFRCTADNFNITEGNLLKYSVSSRSYDYLHTAVDEWQLEPNFIDPADHRTIFDYVARELELNAGNSDFGTIEVYSWGLQAAGAKRCAELIDPAFCGQDSQRNEAAQRAVAAYNEQLRLALLPPYHQW